MTHARLFTAALAVSLVAGCAGDDGADGGAGAGPAAPPSGTPGDAPPAEPGVGPAVGQGGAQDFGQFRAILEAGELPGPGTIDDVGFFNEHRIALGEPECGNDVCLHGHLAVMGNFVSGSNCTMMMMGMTTPLRPDEIERPPLNLAVAIDTSGSMSGAPIEYVREGLASMADALEPDDRVTLVTFADDAQVHVEAVAGDSAELEGAIHAVEAEGQTNVYAGLRAAFEAVERHVDPLAQNRVVLLSDGQATTGLVSDPRLLTMADAYAGAGYGLTTIGVGTDFNPDLMRELSERGGGAFYFLEDPAAVEEVFVEEVAAFLIPLATDVVIDVKVDPGYTLRGMFGTKLAEVTAGGSRIEIPSLQLAHRESAADNDGGRRGGGGAIVAELMPEPGADNDGGVGTLTMTYTVPHTDEVVEQTVEITSELDPGETPKRGLFTSAGAEKSFVTLNLFVGFEMAAYRASVGDGRGALGVLLPLRSAVASWEDNNPDDDIADDLRYVDLFIENLRLHGFEEPPPTYNPPEPWPRD